MKLAVFVTIERRDRERNMKRLFFSNDIKLFGSNWNFFLKFQCWLKSKEVDWCAMMKQRTVLFTSRGTQHIWDGHFPFVLELSEHDQNSHIWKKTREDYKRNNQSISEDGKMFQLMVTNRTGWTKKKKEDSYSNGGFKVDCWECGDISHGLTYFK